MAAVPDSVFSRDGIWTWFNDPRCVYDSSRDMLYVGALRKNGTPWVASWDFTNQIHRLSTPRGVLEVDDHDNPALCLLSSGKILAAYSQHGGDSYSARATTAGSIRAWETEVTANTAGDDSYAHLFQIGDTAETVYWFYRRTVSGTNKNHRLRTSTDDGGSWSDVGAIFDVASNRPYFKIWQPSASRIDFACTNGQPNETTTSLYHFYVTIAADGTRTWYQSDGTAIGGDAELPLGTADVTQVYDGSTSECWVWDAATIGGVPTIAFSVFPSHGTTSHEYHLATFSGGSWSTEKVCDAGTTAAADYLYASEPNYSGGIALDPNSATTVYVSLEYGSGDFRVEKWVDSSGWAKDSDISGNTGTVNARPYCPRGLSPTNVLWWEGTYTSYTSYDTQIRMSPAADWLKAKRSSPSWNSADAPAGVQAYYLISEGSGAPEDLTGNGYDGTNTGTPTWNAAGVDDFGAYLTTFDASNHTRIDSLATAFNAIDGTTFPQWCIVLYKNTSTTFGYAFGLGRSSSNNPLYGLSVNDGGTGVANCPLRDDANVNRSAGSSSPGNVNDGEYHVILAVRESASRNVAYFDGVGIDSDNGAVGTITVDRGCIGGLFRGSFAVPFPGEIHALAVGWGSIDDYEALSWDFLRGQFAGVDEAAAGGGTILPFMQHLCMGKAE